jgi:hypothetical protein
MVPLLCWSAASKAEGASLYTDMPCHEKFGSPPDSVVVGIMAVAVLLVGDEIDDLSDATTLAAILDGVGRRWEVEIGTGPADVACGDAIGERGSLGGGKGVEPDVDAHDEVADLTARGS